MKLSVLALFALVLALAGVARAQPAAPARSDRGFIGEDQIPLAIDDCAPHAPMSGDELHRESVEHYERGEVLYVQGDYKGAVTELVASYCLTPYYTILKDIGQAYERQLEYATAIAYFSRYVLAVPPDAARPSSCSPDPQDDKNNVLARITVLQKLPTKIRVETTPADAVIELFHNGKKLAHGVSGQELEVVGGQYEMIVRRDGYTTLRRSIDAEIGKPYTFAETLKPILGRLHVRVIPGDARLVLDQRQVGNGTLDTALPGGRYTLVAEAPDRVTTRREIEVVTGRDTTIDFELPPTPRDGATQLRASAALGGAVLGGGIASVQDNPGYVAIGVGAGALGAFAAVYFGLPHVPLGQSSMTISTSMIGGVLGGAIGALATADHAARVDTHIAGPLLGAGAIAGGVVGYLTADRLHLRPGDAAVFASGALWGTVTGALFTVSFSAEPRAGGGLVLSGLGFGTVGGALLAHYFSVSRGHAALIDAGGALGIIGGIAVQSVVRRAQGSMPAAPNDPSTGNYALGGMAAGLIAAGVLTRHMDEPKVALTPAVGAAQTAGGAVTTFGFGGAF